MIRRGYAAFGLGAHHDVLAMFGQADGQAERWQIRSLDSTRFHPACEVAAEDLFGAIPPQYEVIGVQPRHWRLDGRGRRLTVMGHYRTRLRGSWDVLTLPFVHIWSITGGRVEGVLSLLDGIELRRLRAAA